MTTTSIRQRVGLVLAGLLNASVIPSAFSPTPEGEVGPPFSVLLLGTALGVVGLVAVIVAWRNGNRVALRIAAGAMIISLLIALPAFFVDVPVWLKAVVALTALLTVSAVVLMFSPTRRPVPALDTEH